MSNIEPLPAASLLDPDIRSQIERIILSPYFKRAAVLQSFFRFVTDEALLGRSASITEYTIAMAVFARDASFDSSIDTIVRTQAYRLRTRLRDYYREEGRVDTVIIDIPKGHYVPVFSRREWDAEIAGPVDSSVREIAASHVQPSSLTVPELAIQPVCPPKQKTGLGRIGWAIILALVTFSFGIFTGSRSSERIRHSTDDDGLQVLDTFWTNFCDTDKQPIVAYGNSLYLADQTGDLLRWRNGPVFDRGAVVNSATAKEGLEKPSLLRRNETVFFNDDLTGTGEVASAVSLTQSLARIGVTPTLKRSRQISTYDLSNHNVIFVGSPFVHVILNDLPNPQNFVFVPPRGPVLLWSAQITNTHPRKGEANFYAMERTPGSQAIARDYALINLRTGLHPREWLRRWPSTGPPGGRRTDTKSAGVTLAGDNQPAVKAKAIATTPTVTEMIASLAIGRGEGKNLESAISFLACEDSHYRRKHVARIRDTEQSLADERNLFPSLPNLHHIRMTSLRRMAVDWSTHRD